MTYQKLHAEYFIRYEKQETWMYDQLTHLEFLEQETSGKMLLWQQIAKLDANIDKLWHQLHQKNIYKANLWKTFSAQKKEQKATDKNKILK